MAWGVSEGGIFWISEDEIVDDGSWVVVLIVGCDGMGEMVV